MVALAGPFVASVCGWAGQQASPADLPRSQEDVQTRYVQRRIGVGSVVVVSAESGQIMSGRNVLATVRRGTRLTVEEVRDGRWYLVGIPNSDQKGFIRATQVTAEKPGRRPARTTEDSGARMPDAGACPIVLQTGHVGRVEDTELSADGRWFVTAGSDRRVVLRDADLGDILRVYLHSASVNSVAFHPAATQIVAGCSDGAVYVWETRTGTLLRRIESGLTRVECVDFHPDGRYFVAAGDVQRKNTFDSSPGRAIVWETRSYEEKIAIPVRYSAALVARFSPVGKTLATGNRSNTRGETAVELWDFEKGVRLWRQEGGHGHPISALEFSSNNAYLAFSDNRIRVVETAGGREVWSFPLSESTSRRAVIHFLPDNESLLIADRESESSSGLATWNVKTKRKVKSAERARGGLSSFFGSLFGGGNSQGPQPIALDVAPEGRQLVVYDDHTAQIIGPSGETMDPKQLTIGRLDYVHSVAFHPRTPHVLMATGRRTIVWELDSGKPSAWFDRSVPSGIGLTDAKFDAGGTRIVASSDRDDAIVWNWPRDGFELRLPAADYLNTCVACSPDGRLVLLAANSDAIMYSANTGMELWRHRFGWPAIRGMLVASDEIIYVAHGKTINRLEYGTGRPVRGPEMLHEATIRCLASSDVARILVSGGDNNQGVIWDLGSGRRVRAMSTTAPVGAVAIANEGRHVALGTDDGSVHLFTTDRGQRVTTFAAHSGMIVAMAFSPDSRRLITGSSDGTFRVWSTRDWRPLLRIVPAREGQEWFVYTPDGRYDHSADGGDLAAVRKGSELEIGPLTKRENGRELGLLGTVWNNAE